MGSIGGLLGTAGRAAGTGFKAPAEANIQSGVTTDQTNQAYNQNQNSLASQQALLAALQAQGGFGAQSSALGAQQNLASQLGGYNPAANQANAYVQSQSLANQQARLNGVGSQQGALSDQARLNAELSANNGAGNLGSAYGQSQNLANQLGAYNGAQNLNSSLAAQQALAQQQQGTLSQYQNIANGTGPNPAQAALNRSTGQNVANQASLMAGQRGAGANVGLIARQAAQQGAAIQQDAVGQSAALQAQQQLNALQGLSAQQQAIGGTNQNVASIAAQQVGLTAAQQQALANQAAQQVGLQQTGTAAQQQAASNLVAQQQAQQQAIAGQAAQQVGQTQAAQAAAAQQANAVAGQQIGATTANTQANQSEQQILQNALAAKNQASVSSQGNVNAGNAAMANTQMQGQQALIGGALNSAGSAMGMPKAKGGLIERPEKMADGGQVPAQVDGPQSSFGKFLQGWGTQIISPSSTQDMSSGQMPSSGPSALQKGASNFGKALASKMKTPTTSASPSTAFTGPDSTDSVGMGAKGGMAKKSDYRSGGNVKAKNVNQKAVKSGNSYDNDKIPALLSEGEVVIPRSVIQGKDPARGAAEFVARALAKRRRKAS